MGISGQDRSAHAGSGQRKAPAAGHMVHMQGLGEKVPHDAAQRGSQGEKQALS